MVTQEKKEKEKKTNYSLFKQKYILPLQSLISVASAESEFSMRDEEARTGPMSSAVQARPKEFRCD